MESSLTESVQQLVRPGKCVDLYYPDPETSGKQCFRTTVNTKYVQQFANLSGGSSVFTIPPNNGVQDIVLVFELPAIAARTDLAIPRGWGYALIKQVSFRYGGSSQYFLSGQQLVQNSLRKAPNASARDDLFSLGGSAATGATLATPQRAYVWLSLPHTIPTADGKLPPLPSDLLTQQIQVTCELNAIPSIFTVGTGGSIAGIPTALNFAEFQVQQVILENQGDALARRVDMTSHALSYPIEFTQQEVVIPLADNATAQTITLTGFRSGEVKNIQCWITVDADAPVGPAVAQAYNPFKWYSPEDMVMTYAGEIYARFDKGSGALWNLVNGRQAPAVNNVTVDNSAAPVITGTFLSRWMELPFAQTYDSVTAHSMYTAGKPITNGIVNLAFNIPQALTPTTGMKLHVSYNYNGVLTFSQGTCDYVI